MRGITVLRKVVAALLFVCLLGIVHGEDDMPSNPLSRLSRKQREHYNVYESINVSMQKDASFDRGKAFVAIYGPIRDWCAEFAPKFKFESMKAGDRARELTNPRKRKELEEKSACYADMFRCCEMIVKHFETRVKSKVQPDVQKFCVLERKARVKGYQLPRREWLSYQEAEGLMIQMIRLRARQKPQEQAQEQRRRQVQQDNSEPRQRRQVQQDNSEPRQRRQRRR